MKNHRFILRPYQGMSTRHECPACNTRRKFSRYIDTATGLELADHVGRCERKDNCGYHYTPSDYFKDEGKLPQDVSSFRTFQQKAEHSTPSFIDKHDFAGTLQGYESNVFAQWLARLFGGKVTSKLISCYLIGTATHGRTIFWQVDKKGKVRTGKIMTYRSDGHRSKEHLPTWVHAVKKDGVPMYPDYNLKQCFFGEHLMNSNPRKAIAIVESEKTAVIASLYLPEYLWLACGGSNGLNVEKMQVLKGRTVSLFPDLGSFELWQDKAFEIAKILTGTQIKVSSLLERKASEVERLQGLDLADYLLRFPLNEFHQTTDRKRNVELDDHQKALAALFDELNSIIPAGEPIMILGESKPCFRTECRRVINGYLSDIGMGNESKWRPYFEEIYRIFGYSADGTRLDSNCETQ